MKIEPPAGQTTAPADAASLRDDAAPAPLALIVGLGNPGPEYAKHRHNIGFQIVQELADRHALSFTRHKKAQARVAEGEIKARPVLLAKPQTFMNLSGKSVRRLSRDHQIPLECMLVVCDDLDLPLGRLRIRPGGGSGGQKGMRSIIESLGSQDFARLRVGIGRPPGGFDPAEYVLLPFEAEDKPLLAETISRAVEAVESWLAEGIVATMDRFNRQPSSTGDDTQEEPGGTAGKELEPGAGPAVLLPIPPGSQENRS